MVIFLTVINLVTFTQGWGAGINLIPVIEAFNGVIRLDEKWNFNLGRIFLNEA